MRALAKRVLIGTPLEQPARLMQAASRGRLSLLTYVYDRETVAVMRRVLSFDSNCIDVGAHAGDILKEMVHYAPAGRHFAFEPLPEFAALLAGRFPCVQVNKLALSDEDGEATFYCADRPALSGLEQRADVLRAKAITVHTATLDGVLPVDLPIRLIKIDVEGAELLVLRGAKETLTRWRPFIVFEHGHGGPELYGYGPEELYALLSQCGLRVNTMRRWLLHRSPLTGDAFQRYFRDGKGFYYLAHP